MGFAEERTKRPGERATVVSGPLRVFFVASSKPDSVPCSSRARRAPAALCAFPRKEVIQPHLPVRLPCYDFVPIAGPAFDGFLPQCGLGHRLRASPTVRTGRAVCTRPGSVFTAALLIRDY